MDGMKGCFKCGFIDSTAQANRTTIFYGIAILGSN